MIQDVVSGRCILDRAFTQLELHPLTVQMTFLLAIQDVLIALPHAENDGQPIILGVF